MGKKQWIIFAVIVAAIIGGLIYASPKNSLDLSDIKGAGSNTILKAEERNGQIGDHLFGNKDAKVLLVEYGDFQCNPGCRQFHENFMPIMQDETYKQKIAFVYRHFPITQIHPNSTAASASAEAAGKQGKFWEMWDALFTNQAEWSPVSATERSSYFEKYASGLGLDIEQFKKDVVSESVSQKIRFDRTLGMDAKVQGTPTLFVNGEQIEGSKFSSTEGLKSIIDKALESAK